MFLPFGDTPNPSGYRAYVTWALIAANVLVYLLVTLPLGRLAVDPEDPLLAQYLRAIGPSLPRGTSLLALLSQTSQYDLFTFAHGYKPGAPEVSDLFTSMFLHGGLLHLAGNMLFLWIFGDNIEHRLGRLAYLAFYLVTGAAATLTFSAFQGDSMVPLVGASGAISGVLGSYFLLFPRNRVKTFVAFYPFFFDVLLLPVRWVLGFYVVVDNLLPLLLNSGSGGVAYGAHIGGFAAGLAVAWVGERIGWRPAWRGRRLKAVAAAGEGPVAAGGGDEPSGALRQAIAAGDGTRALQMLGSVRGEDLDALSPSECATLAGWLDVAGYPGPAARLLRRSLASHPGSRDLARVYLALGLIRLRENQPTAAYQHLLSALESDPDPDPDPETEAQVRAALDRIDVYRKVRRLH